MTTTHDKRSVPAVAVALTVRRRHKGQTVVERPARPPSPIILSS